MVIPPTASLQNLITNLIYYSEYEYAVELVEINAINYEAALSFVLQQEGAELPDVEEVPPQQFFARYEYYIQQSHSDPDTRQNAQRFITLYQFLQQQFDYFHIIKIRSKVPLIPVYFIACKGHNCIGLKTFSVETG